MHRLLSSRLAWRSMCALMALPSCKRSAPSPDGPASIDRATGAASVDASTLARCSALPGVDGFLLGEATRSRGTPTQAAEGGASPSKANPDFAPDDLVPFAAEVGDGVAWAGGFAVGTLHEVAGSLKYAVLTLDARGASGRLVALGAARGEPEPPRVAARGPLLIAGVLEPEGDDRALRLAKIDEHGVTWGATVHEKPGESQAFDIAIGEHKGIVVWDEDGPEVSAIQIATFDPVTVTALTTPRAISARQVDCESPRVLPRPGGFWLTYIARRTNDEDADARYLAEDIGYRWIETVALDGNGSPTGPARVVSPKEGHVLVFDVAEGPDDGAVVVWRDDDTPSGSAGGAVMRAVVRATSVDAPAVLVATEVGAGAPSLIGGWLAVLDAADSTRMAPISPLGELRAPLLPEPELGSGEPVAAGPEGMLIARPFGRAVRLSVVRCTAPPPAP